METLLHSLLQHGVLSSTQYWHLRLLSAISLGPLLGVLYLLVAGWRGRRRSRVAPPATSLWVNSQGQLLALPRP